MSIRQLTLASVPADDPRFPVVNELQIKLSHAGDAEDYAVDTLNVASETLGVYCFKNGHLRALTELQLAQMCIALMLVPLGYLLEVILFGAAAVELATHLGTNARWLRTPAWLGVPLIIQLLEVIVGSRIHVLTERVKSSPSDRGALDRWIRLGQLLAVAMPLAIAATFVAAMRFATTLSVASLTALGIASFVLAIVLHYANIFGAREFTVAWEALSYRRRERRFVGAEMRAKAELMSRSGELRDIFERFAAALFEYNRMASMPFRPVLHEPLRIKLARMYPNHPVLTVAGDLGEMTGD
jgi:hypothetical protein